MFKALRKFFFPVFILGLAVFISFKNYSSGTWLLGWDNLVPELNFKLNIARSVSAVWQEYQGLGLLGGMAHAADLPRQLILYTLSRTVLPSISMVRYFWTFLMLVAGPLGVYYLVKILVGQKGWRAAGNIAGFVSAIFYIFNLATVQTFFTPFETFVSFYGFFPWLLFAAVSYLTRGKRKNLLLFAIISLLGTSAFYVQTLFIVYVIFLAVLSIEASIRYKKDGILRVLKLALVTIFINAFWLAPASYFGLTNANVTTTSHINSIATPETQIMNQARGNFSDVASLKGYWFDYYDWNTDGQYSLLYQDWINYLQNPYITKIFLALFAVSVAGLIIVFLKFKKVYGISFIILLGICLFMLFGGGISFIPLFSEMFRNAFTKWANATALTYSIGLGFFVFIISGLIKNNLKYIPAIILSAGIVAGSIFTTLPILKGRLISGSMKVNLPSYYQDTINYFKTVDPTKRIAGFPFTDFWGWQFNTWGYRGSGFLWYGVPQPVLSRTFDVWSPLNEEFYKEANYAINWGNVDDFERVLAKYQVTYLLFDGSVYEPGNPNSTPDLEKEKAFLESSALISKDKTFGQITIYKVNLSEVNSFVSAPKIDYTQPLFKSGETGNLVISETFLAGQGYKNAKNCNLRESGNVVKQNRGGENYYEAEADGVSCDYFYYPTLDYSKAYAMRIIGKNISGRSLRFYLYNVKGEKVYMDELLPTGNFDKTYVVLPTGTSKDIGGYTLNVETRSFGKIKSENLITAIEFYELPVEKTVPTLIQNNLQIKNVKKFGTWGYEVTASGEGLVALGQGYEKGWVGFETVDNRLKILEHTKVNSWANGWLINDQWSMDNGLTINHQPSTIYVFYWPQALEWGGLILAIFTLLIILWGPAARQP